MNLIEILKNSDSPMLVEKFIQFFYGGMSTLRYAVDAGVNKGFHYHALASLPTRPTVVGVEANPILVEAIKKNGLKPNQVLIDRALVGSTGAEEVTFKINEEFHGRGGVKDSHIWEKINDQIKFEEITVRSVSLDSLLSAQLPQGCDFVKMDIEGSELPVLLASDLVYKLRPIMVIENSVHGPSIAGVDKGEWLKFLSGKGYTAIDFNHEPVNSGTLFRFNHLLLVPHEKVDESADMYKQALQKILKE